MQRFARDHDRVLQSTARAIGLCTLGLSLLCMSLQGVLPVRVLISVIPLYLVVGLCLHRVGRSRSLLWVGSGVVSSLLILVVVQLPIGEGAAPSVLLSMLPIAGGTIPAFALVLNGSVLRTAILASAFISSVVLVRIAAGSPTLPSLESSTVWLGWALIITSSFWLRASMSRASRRVLSIGRAHEAERESSEAEAQQRRSARLLHDTVLATLTLLAHSGVGVSPEVLKKQAASDARLLRQLRLNNTAPTTDQEPDSDLAALEDSSRGHTLQTLKTHFERADFAVRWHGVNYVQLEDRLLDSFLLALAECLENARRHSGAVEADVTIISDESAVRAMVTDSGVGFALTDVHAARLGFKESIVGRLKDVGGNARLFSSPASGTTVVLEVPR